jgi:Flp pilus assembly protein TadG
MVKRGRVCCLTVGGARRGAALVEAAVLAGLLAFLFLMVVDYARIFYCTVTLENAASAGALYASRDASHSTDTTAISAAALLDAGDLSPTPKVTSSTGTDSNGDNTVTVTVTYTFSTIASYPGIPNQSTVTSKVTMRVLP